MKMIERADCGMRENSETPVLHHLCQCKMCTLLKSMWQQCLR